MGVLAGPFLGSGTPIPGLQQTADDFATRGPKHPLNPAKPQEQHPRPPFCFHSTDASLTQQALPGSASPVAQHLDVRRCEEGTIFLRVGNTISPTGSPLAFYRVGSAQAQLFPRTAGVVGSVAAGL